MSVDTEEEKAHWVRCFGAYSVLSEAEIAKVSQAVEQEVQLPILSALPTAREEDEEEDDSESEDEDDDEEGSEDTGSPEGEPEEEEEEEEEEAPVMLNRGRRPTGTPAKPAPTQRTSGGGGGRSLKERAWAMAERDARRGLQSVYEKKEPHEGVPPG